METVCSLSRALHSSTLGSIIVHKPPCSGPQTIANCRNEYGTSPSAFVSSYNNFTSSLLSSRRSSGTGLGKHFLSPDVTGALNPSSVCLAMAERGSVPSICSSSGNLSWVRCKCMMSGARSATPNCSHSFNGSIFSFGEWRKIRNLDGGNSWSPCSRAMAMAMPTLRFPAQLGSKSQTRTMTCLAHVFGAFDRHAAEQQRRPHGVFHQLCGPTGQCGTGPLVPEEETQEPVPEQGPPSITVNNSDVPVASPVELESAEVDWHAFQARLVATEHTTTHNDTGTSSDKESILDEGAVDDVLAEGAVEVLFEMLEKPRVAVDKDNKEVSTDVDNGEESQTVVYLEAWQIKKMAAAAELGAHCVNLEALAAEVGLPRPDVLAWLEMTASQADQADPGVGSYMEDVHILEEVEKPAKYVPPPPIPAGDVNMRSRVEDLMYSLKEVIPGLLASIDDYEKWKATMKLFSETVELQDPLFCLRGKTRFLEWLQHLAHSGVVIDLHDIYYENITSYQVNRWVYVVWTATLTSDLPMSILQLGLTDWWAKHHGPEFMHSQKLRKRTDLEDYDGKLNTGGDEEYDEDNHVVKATFNRLLQLSGEAKFEMDKSGQVTNVCIQWYRTAKQRDGDFTNAKLLLSGLLNTWVS